MAAPRASRWPLIALVAAGALGAAFLLFGRAPQATSDAPTFTLRLYGKDAPGQRSRAIADFPFPSDTVIGMRAELQYFGTAPPPGRWLVVETRGAMKTLRAVAAESDSLELIPVGSPFAVGALGPGEAQVCAALVDGADAGLIGPTKCSSLLVSP